MGMRMDLAGLAKNAANTIEMLVEKIRDYDNSDMTFTGLHVFDLLELARHVRETREGKHTLDEFADVYCLKD